MIEQNLKKRIIVITSWILFLGALGFIFYYFFTPDATCTDKKQNQSEKGIDCGGPCSPCRASVQTQDMITKEVAFADGGNGTWDVEAKISNPNDMVGAKNFKYVFTLKDATGNIIAKREGNSFILPIDSKYIVELGIEISNNAVPASASMEINSIDWESL